MAVEGTSASPAENVVDNATRRDSVMDHSKVRVNVAEAARLEALATAFEERNHQAVAPRRGGEHERP